MSNSSAVATATVSEALDPSEICIGPPLRSSRSAGKGRRRRAVAEQRRAEQELWSHLVHNGEDDIYVTPPAPPISRRQLRRAARFSPDEDWEDADDDHLEIDLAISLSLLDTPHGSDRVTAGGSSFSPDYQPLDMSYESLVRLENVKCTAPTALTKSLCGHIFEKDGGVLSSLSVDDRCTICQGEYKDGDSCMLLPCLHPLHDECGLEWFLNHSKLCPVCKHDITEE